MALIGSLTLNGTTLDSAYVIASEFSERTDNTSLVTFEVYTNEAAYTTGVAALASTEVIVGCDGTEDTLVKFEQMASDSGMYGDFTIVTTATKATPIFAVNLAAAAAAKAAETGKTSITSTISALTSADLMNVITS